MLRFKPLAVFALLTAGALPLAHHANAAPRNGTLAVKSETKRATLWVDGQKSGTAPKTLTLKAGSHLLFVQRPGYGLFTAQVQVRGGRQTVVKANLAPAEQLSTELRGLRKTLAGGLAREVRTWAGGALLSESLPLGDLLGGFSGIRGVEDEVFRVEDLYATLSLDFDDLFNLVATVSLYQDEALTQPAGFLTMTLDGEVVFTQYEITAGKFAGVSGELTTTVDPEGGAVLTGGGSLPGGATWTSQFTLNLEDGLGSLQGSVDVTQPGGGTEHWELSGSGNAQSFTITTSEGHTLTLQLLPDGSLRGELTETESGKLLGAITISRGGVVTLLHSDGTTETFRLWEGP